MYCVINHYNDILYQTPPSHPYFNKKKAQGKTCFKKHTKLILEYDNNNNTNGLRTREEMTKKMCRTDRTDRKALNTEMPFFLLY